MNIQRSAQNVICRKFRKKHDQTVKLLVWERWNPSIIYNFFFHKVAIGWVNVAMMSVCLPPRTHLSTTRTTNPNNFPAPSTTKIDAKLSKPTDTQDGTEQQPE